LWVRLQKGQVNRHDIEDEARFHELAWEQLAEAGYLQYEVSNFARPGHACQHNLNTWRMQEWIGYGPSASSQCGSRRWTEPHSLEEWLTGIQSGNPRYADEVELDTRMLAQDSLIFGLRMNEGVNLAEWHSRFGKAPLAEWDPFMDRMVDESLAELDGDLLKLTSKGRLLADRIGEEILNL
jgi:oxygen-independent coproporphyrinogen-3 oxidase